MEDCFHKSCDVASSLPDFAASLSFLSDITQALVLATYELTMPLNSSYLNECTTLTSEFSKIPKDEPQKMPNEIHELTMNENPFREWNVKNYQPNTGTQINIEKLYVNNMNLGGSEVPPKEQKISDLLLLMEKTDPLAQIVNRYFDKQDQKKTKKNSPMLIKLMKEL